MKAVILSGGSGVRLAPLTNTITKQLLEVANKPVLFHILDKIKEETDINEICVVVSEDFGNQVKEEILNSAYAKYFTFSFVFQDKPLGLAHAVQITNMHVGNEPFIMFLGDILIAKGEVKNAYDQFLKNNPESLVVLKLVEKPQDPKSNLCLAGIYFFKPSIFYAIVNIKPSYRQELEITDAVDFQIGQNKIVEYYIIKGYWLDVGTPENMIKANELLLDNIENKTSSKLSDSVEIKGKAFIEENVEINDTEIVGPVIIGRNTKIKGSKIGPYVSIAKNVSLVDSCIENSIIREGCKISGKASVISKSLIGKNVDLVFKGTIDNKKIMYVLGDNTKCISL